MISQPTNHEYRFTWRTISTWLYRYKRHGITTLDNRTRSDKSSTRKVQVNELAEAINDIIGSFSTNKVGKTPKMALYRRLLERNYFQRSQLSQTTFYRLLRDNDLLTQQSIDDASESLPTVTDFFSCKVCIHHILVNIFFYRDNTACMIEAFRTALFKRGKPERLYFDNGEIIHQK